MLCNNSRSAGWLAGTRRRRRHGLPELTLMPQSSSSHKAARFPAWLLICASLTAIAPLSIDMYLPSFPALSATCTWISARYS